MRGVIASVLGMVNRGVTHIAVATDHVIESFRNSLWPGYKTSAGVDADLLAQFHPLERALTALGITVWPMVEVEADDALAAGAALAALDDRVDRVVICTPDKDLSQCVRGKRVVQLDRRRNLIRNEEGVIEKFGVLPASIPDYLALVGDSSDGYPGLHGWGRNRRRRCSPSSATSSRFPKTRDSGASTRPTPHRWPQRSSASAIVPTCFARSPRCGRTCRSSRRSTN